MYDKIQYTTNLLILDYLLRNCHVNAFIQLQRSNKIVLDSSVQVALIRRLIYKGEFNQLQSLLQIISAGLSQQRSKKIFLSLQKQKLYEQVQNPSQQQIMQIFQGKNGLQQLCKGDVNQYYYFLMLNSMSDQFEGWNIQRGRAQCFEQIIRVIQQAGLYQTNSKLKTTYKLQDMVNYFINQLKAPNLIESQKQTQQKQQLKQQCSKQQIKYINIQSQYVSSGQEKINFKIQQAPSDQQIIGFLSRNIQSQPKQVHSVIKPTQFLKLQTIFEISDTKTIRTAKFSENKMLALSINSNTLRLYQLPQTGKLSSTNITKISQRPIHKGSILDLHWKNQRQILSCSNDNKINISMIRKDVQGHLHSVQIAKVKDCLLKGVAWMGDQIVSYSDSNFIQIWDPTRMSSTTKIYDRLLGCLKTGYKGGINQVLYYNWNLYTANQSNSITIFDIRTNKVVNNLRLDGQPIWLQSYKSQIYCITQDGLLHILDTSLQQIGKHRLQKQIRSVNFWKENLAICKCNYGQLGILRLYDGIPNLQIKQKHNGDITCTGWRSSGQAISCGTDSKCKIYNVIRQHQFINK